MDKVLPRTTLYTQRSFYTHTQRSFHTEKLYTREAFTDREAISCIQWQQAPPKPDLGAKAKKTILKHFLKGIYKGKSPAPN